MQITLVSVTLCVHESPNISVAEGSFTVYEAPSAEWANSGKSGFEILAFELSFSHNWTPQWYEGKSNKPLFSDLRVSVFDSRGNMKIMARRMLWQV